MTQLKLTKNELRDQQYKLGQLTKYLPTLQLKKALLQVEVHQAQVALDELEHAKKKLVDRFEASKMLLGYQDISELLSAALVREVHTAVENIAGVEVPHFLGIDFYPRTYLLTSSPLWFDSALQELRAIATIKEKIRIGETKKKALEKELREVSIRVNLFEKILIPRTKANIKKIKIFLGDLQLSSVAQAKVAKAKIEARRKAV